MPFPPNCQQRVAPIPSSLPTNGFWGVDMLAIPGLGGGLLRVGKTGVALSLVVALASSCGGSSKPSTTKTTVGAGTTSTAGVTTTTISPDVAKAQGALLSLSDLPAGWTATPTDNSGDNIGLGGQDGTAQLASCLGVATSSLDSNPPQADSPTFTSPDEALTVDDEVQVFPTVAAAVNDFSLFSSSKTPACITQVFNGPLRKQFTDELQPGQTLSSVSSTARTFPRVGDHSGDVQITFVVGQSGTNVKVFLDLIVVTKGRSETILTVTQPQVLAQPGLTSQLAGIAAGRMTA
jgi:hypothetical protein